MAIIASKSSYFQKILKDKQAQLQSNDEIVIDFEEQVLYEAFKKIVDYLYLDDISVLEGI